MSRPWDASTGSDGLDEGWGLHSSQHPDFLLALQPGTANQFYTDLFPSLAQEDGCLPGDDPFS